MKRGFLLLSAVLVLTAAAPAAEEASIQDDMRFVQELRNQGRSDLALEYLQRLAKNPSPELAKELPLELAKTRLEAASDEADSGKRLNLYNDAREELQKWLAANPTHPRNSEVKLDMAQVAVLQGRTQLSRALMNPDFSEVMTPDATKARALLEDAGAQIKAAAKDVDAQIAKLGEAKTPDEKTLKKNLENEALKAQLNVGLNLFDQAQAFPLEAKSLDLRDARGKKIGEAKAVFQKVMAKEENNPICWVARAWYGRCYQEETDNAHARSEYDKIMEADARAKDAKRLARYFKLLAMHEKPEKGEDGPFLIRSAKDWIADYPGYLKTPEGYGLRYLLAKVYFQETNENPKLQAADKIAYWREARKLLHQVELSENDFTDQARQLKINVIYKQQGGFTEPVAKLKDFEDCYVRAQFEQMEIAKDEKTIKNPDDLEKKKKEHLATITAALEKGLKLAKPGEAPLELGNAKAMLAFQYLNAKKYAEAIGIAEPFAHGDPRSAQAAAAAAYALQSYAEMISHQEQAGTTPEELKTQRDKLIALAGFMEKNWPKEQAGDMARNQLALLYINDKDPEKREENVQQAVLALARITPSYSNYTVTQYQLAQFALDAEKEKIKPIAGDAPDGYRKRALAALENMPPLTVGAEPTTNKFSFLAKVRLGQELFTLKRYDDMEKLSDATLPTLAGVDLDADKAKSEELRGQLADSLKSFKLYARWAKADGEVKAADKADAAGKTAAYTKVMEQLDPLVDEIIAKQHPELKNNLALARGILDNDLRSSIQLNKLDRTRVILNGYKELTTDNAADAGAAEVLKQLVVFIPPQLEELKHKTGEEAQKNLANAKEKFGVILEDTIKPLGDKLTPKLIYFTSQIYSSMDNHKAAADLLAKVAEPAKDAAKSDLDLYQSERVMLARERRLGDEKEESRKVMDSIMNPPKTAWGRKKVDALMENAELLGAEGNNKQAAEFANALIQKLLPRIDSDNKTKEIYLQCYYIVVENVFHQAQKLKDKAPEKYAKGVTTAVTLAVDLAKKQAGFVNDTTRNRFRDLMDSDPELKAAFVTADLTAVETAMAKQGGDVKDKSAHDKAVSDVASMVVDLEKMWPDYGGDEAKGRVTALLANAELKAAYDQQKGSALR
jgi:hypothetical protein